MAHAARFIIAPRAVAIAARHAALATALVVLAGRGHSHAFSGVQTNVPEASLGGWSLCYSDTYANSSTMLADILAACDGPNLLLACRPVGSPDLSVLAHAPRPDVITDTGQSNTPHDANGVGWYFNDSWSWGFAPQGDAIYRYSCDTDFGGSPEKHMCWHTYSGFINGGWRCGTNYNIFDAGWERLVYEGSLSCGDGVIDAGEACDDGDLTSGDGCSNGCQIEECYGCSGAPSTCFALPDGSDCEDGLFCNGGDSCASATCTVHDGDPCSGGGECAETCNEGTNTCADPIYTACTDDGNVCTSDYCNGTGTCAHDPQYYTPCDDGLFCNGTDYCYAGVCDQHYGDPCLYTYNCNTVCDEGSELCGPSPIGESCYDDGNICTSDSCDGAGTCLHPPTANGSFCYDDGNVCTGDSCDGTGTCIHPPAPSGGACPDDGLVCTGDTCDGAGACGHPPLPSSAPCPTDGNECTSDHCDGAGACAHSAVGDGTGCDDEDSCTQTDECAAGTCVGSDEIVCSAPACLQPGTCDPTSGTCTTCPAGYTQGAGGCQKTYVIDASLLDGVVNSCSIYDPYSSCDIAVFGFHWSDTGDAGVGAVIQVDLTLTSGVDCANAPHAVTLNGLVVGALPYASVCYCLPAHTAQALADVDTSTYVKGGANAISIATNSCFGLSDDGSGQYAAVTVTYADLGPQPAVETGCRTAPRSKLKYKNSADNAKDKLGWKWLKGAATTHAEFGNPTSTADYQLCVFRQSSGSPTVLFGGDVPASNSLWSVAGGSTYKYGDGAGAQEGLSKILLKSGVAGKSKIILKGKGGGLSDPTLPLAGGTTGILVQLTNEDSGLCWQSTFPLASVSQSASGLKAQTP